MTTPLQQAAQALIETWDRSSYIGEEVEQLRKALNAKLATEPSGERAELIANLRSQECCQAHGGTGSHHTRCKECPRNVVDMLEADAQQAKRVPMTDREISEIVNRYYRLMGPTEFARAIEAHHGITEPEEDLYALALKADNWGQP